MSKLIITRSYGHPQAGHTTMEWQPRVAVKEWTQVEADSQAKAESEFYVAMAQSGAFAFMKMQPADVEYVVADKFNPDAYEVVIHQQVAAGLTEILGRIFENKWLTGY